MSEDLAHSLVADEEQRDFDLAISLSSENVCFKWVTLINLFKEI